MHIMHIANKCITRTRYNGTKIQDQQRSACINAQSPPAVKCKRISTQLIHQRPLYRVLLRIKSIACKFQRAR